MVPLYQAIHLGLVRFVRWSKLQWWLGLVILWLSLPLMCDTSPHRRYNNSRGNTKMNSMPSGISVAVQTELEVDLLAPDFTDGDIRLTNGKLPNQGRVEIYFHGTWGTICDNGWGINEANVVCRQLGYQQAIKSEKQSRFGPGIDVDILLDRVYCHGDELRLTDCEHAEWHYHRCSHEKEAGVVCDITIEPMSLSVGKISGIAVFCLTCIAYICLACAKNNRRRSTRARRGTLCRDYTLPSSTASRSTTCHSHSTQTGTSDTENNAMLQARTHLPEHSMVNSESGLPSYDEHMADLPPPYESIAPDDANRSLSAHSVESLGYGTSSDDQDVSGADGLPKDEPLAYVF